MVKSLSKIFKQEKLLEFVEKILQKSYFLIFVLFIISFFIASIFSFNYYFRKKEKKESELIIQRDFITQFKRILEEREKKLKEIREFQLKDPFLEF